MLNVNYSAMCLLLKTLSFGGVAGTEVAGRLSDPSDEVGQCVVLWKYKFDYFIHTLSHVW